MKIYKPCGRTWDASSCCDGCCGGGGRRCPICGERDCDCDVRPYPPTAHEPTPPATPCFGDLFPTAPAYGELYSTTNATVGVGALLPLTQSNAFDGVLLNHAEGTITVETSGVYLVNYAAAAAAVGGSFGLSIDSSLVPNSEVSNAVADLLISNTRLIPLYAGQTIGVAAVDSFTLSSVTNGSNASLVITKLDFFD